jgi:hypothetical protein
MQQVEAYINVASDGSGWSISKTFDTRIAFVWKTPDETYMGSGYILLVPLTDSELESFSQQNVISKGGIDCLKIPNFKERYIK